MNIEFERQTFYEEDDTWDALFVRINDGKWMLAKAHFNTEDEELIKEIIESNGKENS